MLYEYFGKNVSTNVVLGDKYQQVLYEYLLNGLPIPSVNHDKYQQVLYEYFNRKEAFVLAKG